MRVDAQHANAGGQGEKHAHRQLGLHAIDIDFDDVSRSKLQQNRAQVAPCQFVAAQNTERAGRDGQAQRALKRAEAAHVSRGESLRVNEIDAELADGGQAGGCGQHVAAGATSDPEPCRLERRQSRQDCRRNRGRQVGAEPGERGEGGRRGARQGGNGTLGQGGGDVEVAKLLLLGERVPDVAPESERRRRLKRVRRHNNDAKEGAGPANKCRALRARSTIRRGQRELEKRGEGKIVNAFPLACAHREPTNVRRVQPATFRRNAQQVRRYRVAPYRRS